MALEHTEPTESGGKTTARETLAAEATKPGDSTTLDTADTKLPDGLPTLEVAHLEETEADGEVLPRGEMNTVKLNVGGDEREYQIYIPEGHEGKDLPVVYALHGVLNHEPHGLMAKETEFNRYAEERGFAVVYPLAKFGDGENGDGLASWNSEGAGLTETDASYDDVDYMKAVVDSVQNKLGLNIDKGDQILAGFSEGGQFVHHLAGSMTGVFSDRASVHGTLLGTEAKPNEGMPTLIIHGNADEMLPMEGGMGVASWAAHQVTGAFEKVRGSDPALQLKWAHEANGCNENFTIDRDSETKDIGYGMSKLFVKEEINFSAANCRSGPLTMIRLAPGQHAWHGVGEGGMPMGYKNPEFNASEAILDRLLGK